jgi:hypothetical protein
MEKTQENSKPRGIPFPKGVSGNPGGRPKQDPDVVAIFKAAAPDVAAQLVDLALHCSSPRVRAQACDAILDRLYGRPSQPIDATLGGSGAPISILFEGALEQWSK